MGVCCCIFLDTPPTGKIRTLPGRHSQEIFICRAPEIHPRQDGPFAKFSGFGQAQRLMPASLIPDCIFQHNPQNKKSSAHGSGTDKVWNFHLSDLASDKDKISSPRCAEVKIGAKYRFKLLRTSQILESLVNNLVKFTKNSMLATIWVSCSRL